MKLKLHLLKLGKFPRLFGKCQTLNHLSHEWLSRREYVFLLRPTFSLPISYSCHYQDRRKLIQRVGLCFIWTSIVLRNRVHHRILSSRIFWFFSMVLKLFRLKMSQTLYDLGFRNRRLNRWINFFHRIDWNLWRKVRHLGSFLPLHPFQSHFSLSLPSFVFQSEYIFQWFLYLFFLYFFLFQVLK